MRRSLLFVLLLATACPKPAPPKPPVPLSADELRAPAYALGGLSEEKRPRYQEALQALTSPCEQPETLYDAAGASRCPEAVYLARVAYRALRDQDATALDLAGFLGALAEARRANAAIRVELDTSQAPARGPDGAVALVEFADFQCGHCAHLHDELETIKAKLDATTRFSFKNLPLSSHLNAEPAARAALAAHQQGKFWEYSHLLFTRQAEIEPNRFVEWARELGLDENRFQADFTSDKLSRQVAADREEALALGLRGTPALFLNNQPLLGPLEAEAIWDAVVFALAAKGKAPAPEPPK